VNHLKKRQSPEHSDYSGMGELVKAEVMRNYNAFIVKSAMKDFHDAKTVVDFGAGIGTLSLVFRELFSIEPLCVEIDSKNKECLTERGLEHIDSLESLNESVDLIFSSNVLEHIEDDVSILEKMRDKLSLKGKIYLYLPAKMSLWSNLDDQVGHYRRYEINELKVKCQKAGLNIEKLHYAESLGFLASLLTKVLGYNSDSGIGSISTLKFYDKYLFPISKFLDAIGVKYLFGKNIILIASKK